MAVRERPAGEPPARHPVPAVALHDQIARAFEKQYALLREREQTKGEDGQAAIDAVLAEFAAREDEA